MKLNLAIILSLLSYLNTSCSGTDTKSQRSNLSNVVNIRKLTGYDSTHVNFSYLTDSSLNELYVINGDTIYYIGIKNNIIRRCATSNLVNGNLLKKSYSKLIYYELKPAVLIYAWDRNQGIDSLMHIMLLDSQFRKNQVIDIRIKNASMLKDMYLVSGIKRIDLASNYSLIVTCDQSHNYVINDRELSYYQNDKGDHAIYDPIEKSVFAIKKIDKNGKSDSYLYKNIGDTLLLASTDSVLKNYTYMGNPMIIGSRLFVKSVGSYYELGQRRWVKLSHVDPSVRVFCNGKGFLWSENGMIHIETF